MRVEKRLLPLPTDAVAHGPEAVTVRSGESVTQRHVAIGRDAHQTNAGTTWISLGVTLVQLLKRLSNVREPVMAVLERGIAILEGQRLELPQQLIESLVTDGVVALGRRRDRSKTDFPEPHLVGQVAIDASDVERLSGQRDSRANRTRSVPGQAAP